MDNNGYVSFKMYLPRTDSTEPEIRRFGLQKAVATNYNLFVTRVIEIFPRLSDMVFTICWKDEDGDEIAISSDEELIIALASIKSDVKTFYVKVQSGMNGPTECDNLVLHPGVFCDGCNCSIAGFRYKCLVCKDYDLCSACEYSGIHAEHPVLRFSNKFCFDRMKLRKMTYAMHSSNPVVIEIKRPRRHHEGGYPEFCKKKKRCDKRESESETADESEDGCHKKHSHKKCKKLDKCPYSQMMSNVFSYFNPAQFQQGSSADLCSEKPRESACHMSYLRSVGLTLQKLLDPLGVNVELEVRPKGEKHEEKKEEGKKEEHRNEAEMPEPAPSGPTQKEVRFDSSEQKNETMKQKIDEITKILANQSMSRSQSASNDGWVLFEELKKDLEPRRRQSTGGVPVMFDLEGNSSESNKSEPEVPSQPQETQNLYPNLKPPQSQVSSNPKVNAALEKMLAMGFSNEGNWLSQLLEKKNGDINQVLEVLSFQKEN